MIGEIEDHARESVRAYLGTSEDRQPLGTYPDRKSAIRAVSQAARAGEARA
jgi:hypothetical protein